MSTSTPSTSDTSAPQANATGALSTDNLLVGLSSLSTSDTSALIGRNRLSQALELEEPRDNRFLKRTLYGLGGAALIFFPWAALTPITQVVQASGEVVPKGAVNVVQHLEGGIVASVAVKNGQTVREGETLLTLNPKLVGSEYSAMQAKLAALQQQQQQLQAAIRGDGDLRASSSQAGSIEKITQAQKDLLESRLGNIADQVKASESIVAEKTAEVSGLNEQLRLAEKEMRMWASLTDSGAASQLQLNTSQARVAQTRTARNEAQKALAQARANLRGLRSGLVFEQHSQIAQLVNEESVVAENIKKIKFQLDRTQVKAPVDGVVSDLRFQAPGAVVGPGAVVASVVPKGSNKLVDVRIPSQDIGFVTVGQDVKVNVTPYDSSVYGSIPGKLISISGNTVQDPDDRKFYYSAQVKLDRQTVHSSGSKYPIQVGMPVVADIQGQRSSVLRYLFQPFVRTLGGAMRE